MSSRDSNTWSSKAKRSFTAFLPVDSRREGECAHCGKCCKLPIPCPFYDENSEKHCRIHSIRPMNCRKYPRTPQEQVVLPCGYRFPEGIDENSQGDNPVPDER